MTADLAGLLALVAAALGAVLLVAPFVRGLRDGYGRDPAKYRETVRDGLRRGRQVSEREGLPWVEEDGTIRRSEGHAE